MRHYLEIESLERLFFTRDSCQLMTVLNWEKLIINCIYKINKYVMSLCMISKVISLNNNFYIVFAFLSSKITSSYEWILRQLMKLYKKLNIRNLIFVVIDCEVNLIKIILRIYLDVQYALCFWHVDKNVVKNCKDSFDDDETWKTFYDDWHQVMYVSLKVMYETV